MKRRVTYRSLEEDPSYEHPVDRLVRIRVGRRDLQRIVATKSHAIVKGLGARKRLWFDFEQADDEIRARREAAYFDAGAEHQAVVETADELKVRRKAVQELGLKLAREVLGSGVKRDDAVAAVVLAAWAMLGSPIRDECANARSTKTR